MATFIRIMVARIIPPLIMIEIMKGEFTVMAPLFDVVTSNEAVKELEGN